jgi:DNA-directed RNA polymerase subunit RPC12/RpoP
MSEAVSPPSPSEAAGEENAADPHDAGAGPLGILGLDLKFLCRECGTKLIIDVRWQGRKLNCPHCGTPAVVPHYREVLRVSDRAQKPSSAAGHGTATSRLSDAEIEFLSTPGETSPGVDCAP